MCAKIFYPIIRGPINTRLMTHVGIVLKRLKWVKMLDLKADFYTIPFEHALSYNSILVMHCGKFGW